MVKVSSWGRLSAELHNVHYLSTSQDLDKSDGLAIAYGMGRSYGDECLNPAGKLWNTTSLDNFISFDQASGVLRCQAGVQLYTINQLTIPRGWMLAVTPGTQFVTVGGAVANDVHGKNHHMYGSFGHHVLGLTLQRSSGEIIICSPISNKEWFEATLAGFGMTGIILEVTLQLKNVDGPWLDTETIPFSNLTEFYQISDASEKEWEYTVSWIDCTSKAGIKGLFMRGNNANAISKPLPKSKKLNVPFIMPFSLVNQLSLKPFNTLYYYLNCLKAKKQVAHYESFFYPLDNIRNWNLIYGKKGFFQYQAVIPHHNRLDAIDAMLKQIAKVNMGSFLAVLKTFGDVKPTGLMSFPIYGATLALDFSNGGERTLKLFSNLDAILREAKGRIYLAKDARMPKELFEAGYPRLQEFLAYRDPGISSALSRRLIGS